MYTLGIKLSKNRKFTSRVVYEIFGFLSNIGGFTGTIVSLMSLVMGLYTQWTAYYKVVSQMFFMRHRLPQRSNIL
jgi:hypothetical protein